MKVLHEYPSHSKDDVLTLGVGDLYAREPRRNLMAVSEELQDLESMAMSFDDQQVSAADVKYMKQRADSAHRSRRESLERYRRGDK